ncbi:hypothetical protein GCM10018987_09670 [Streptomyces cremeus]
MATRYKTSATHLTGQAENSSSSHDAPDPKPATLNFVTYTQSSMTQDVGQPGVRVNSVLHIRVL